MYFENKSGRIYYEDYGPKNAQTIVFTHGMTMDHRTFQEQIEFLQDKYRIIVWDMPCHGQSSPIDTRLPFSSTAADMMMDLLDHLKIEKAVLAGLSLGSVVTQRAASQYAERVIAMVHISGQSLYPKRSGMLRIMEPLFAVSVKVLSESMLAKSFAKHKTVTSHTLKYLVEGFHHTGKQVYLHLTKELIRDLQTGIPQPLKQPMLIIYGDHESGMIQKMHKKWHALAPNSQIVRIKNAHHITNQDNPEEFNQALLSFLQGA